MRLVFIYLEEGIIKEVIPNNCSNVILFWFSHIFFNPFFGIIISNNCLCREVFSYVCIYLFTGV